MKNTNRLERRIFLPAGTAVLLAVCNTAGAVEYADFNGDGYDDLAIGVYGESIGARSRAGAVNVLYGSPNRLTAAHNQIWHQDSPDIKGVAEAGDEFGRSLAAGDFDGDGNSDLAVGVPGEGFNGESSAGVVNVFTVRRTWTYRGRRSSSAV